MAQGPQFVQYLAPILDALRELGGSAVPDAVRERIASKHDLTPDVLNARTSSGSFRFENQVAWARFYLSRAGLLDSKRRGIWTLSKAGWDAHLSEEDAQQLFKDVFASFKSQMDDVDEDAPFESETQADAVEGADDAASLGDYPIDGVLIRHEQRTVHDVVRRIKQGVYVMDPDFQREFIWDAERQSRLIESVLMRIPLPVIYLAEDGDGRLVVVDGLQRLTTFDNFLNGRFALRLDNSALNGKRFDDLSPKLKNRIEDAQLIIYLIDSKVPERARLDIFDRVNSGVPLTRQQMRNSLYQGAATRLLKVLSEHRAFLAATAGSLERRTMRDREAINRFCSFFVLGFDAYQDDMDAFLAEGLRRMNRMDAFQISGIHDSFVCSMENNQEVFGEHAFRRHQRDQARRSVINMSLFDVASVAFALYSRDRVAPMQERLREGFFQLLNDRLFSDAISLGTSDRAKVAVRFRKFNDMVKGVLGDS